VYRVPVTPSAPHRRRGVEFHCVAGYMGLPYYYWRGSVEYAVYIPSTKTIHGAMQVFWSPTLGVSPEDVDPTQWGVGTSLEFSGTQFKTIRVPYDQALGAKENVCVYPGVMIAPQWVNGELLFYLTTPLVSPKSTGAITVIILVRGGDDLSFSGYKHLGKLASGGLCPWKSILRLNAGDDSNAVDLDAVSSTSVLGNAAVVASPSDDSLLRSSVAHSSFIGSVVFKKPTGGTKSYTGWVRAPPALGVADAGLLANSNICPAAVSGVGSIWTWFGHYSAMFCGVRCGTDFTLVGRSSGVTRVRLTRISASEYVSVADMQSAEERFNASGACDGESSGVDTVVVNLTQHESYTHQSRVSDSQVFHSPLAKFFSSGERDRDGRLVDFAGEYLRIDSDVCSANDSCTEIQIDVYAAVSSDVSFMHFRRVPGVSRRDGAGYLVVEKS